MEYTFETVYDGKACTAIARALRKTVRRKRSLRTHIFGWIVILLGLFLSLPIGDEEYVITASTVVTWIAVLAILIVLLFEDRINGWIAQKRHLAGTEKVKAVFTEEGYTTAAEMAKTEWKYDKIHTLAETETYVVFLFSTMHGQVYDKRTLTGGTEDKFRAFLEEVTGKKMQYVGKKKRK